ncbi:MAG: DUF3105 domain-containing protein [Solirubrobacterales bacterium]
MSSRREEKERLRAERLAAEQHEQSSARRRLIAGYVVAGLLGAAVLAGLVVVVTSGGDGGGNGGGSSCGENAHVEIDSGVTDGLECDEREGTAPPPIQLGDLEQSARMAGCELNLNLPDEGNSHFTDEAQGDEPGAYKTVPPTSGDHYGAPAENGSGALADGAYRERPPTARTVHSMEHGRIEIHYDPELPEEEQLALKGVFDEDPDGILLFPDGEAPYASKPPDYAVAVTAWQNQVVCPEYNEVVLDVVRNFRDTFRGNGPENVPISL